MESVWITRQLCWHEGADSGLASDPAECETNELMDGRCGSPDIPGGSHIQAHLGWRCFMADYRDAAINPQLLQRRMFMFTG